LVAIFAVSSLLCAATFTIAESLAKVDLFASQSAKPQSEGLSLFTSDVACFLNSNFINLNRIL
jgi:hypothetical protein